MDQAVLDAMNIFYKLKARYEKEGDKIKQKIINRDDLTMAEKRDLFQTQKRKCINCKKPVGTLFNVDDKQLVALCGATQDPEGGTPPCDLNIKIIKGSVVQLPDYVNELREKHKQLVNAIIKVKYNLLFKYASEEETVTDFEKERNEFDKTTTLYDLYKTKLIQITTLLEKRERISITDLQLFEFVKDIQENVEESVKTANPQLLKDSVELYIHRVLDVLKENRELKYSYQAIEQEENGDFRLVQKPYTQAETETVIGDGFKVTSLKMKAK